MRNLDRILREATSAIGSEYFRLPIYAADPKYRERVYCYELYHQMRTLWPARSAWRLNGEVDKRAHPYFADESETAPKPDLLVHVPGTARNAAVIEVKPVGSDRRGLEKDLRTLDLFEKDFCYQRAISLIFGMSPEEASCAFAEAIANSGVRKPRIELWLHEVPGAPAYRLK